MLKPIIFWGATGQARVLREIICGVYNLIALFDNNSSRTTPFPGIPVHYGKQGFLRWRHGNPGADIAFLVAIGGVHGQDRLSLQRFLEGQDLIPINVIHPRAFVAASASLGSGCQVLANAAVCAEVKAGDACIINTAASVDHECVLGEGVHIGPGAVLAGCVNVASGAMVGAGAVVLPRVKIGEKSLVGAGAVVTKDVPNNVIVYGNPARIVRTNV